MPADFCDLLVTSQRVVTPEGVRPAAVAVVEGVVVAVEDLETAAGRPARLCVEAGDDVVMPGLVDTHVHVNEPGRTEWEGFATATRAAAAGGVTTLVDMPLNSSPVTTTVAALKEKVAAATGQCLVDHGFWAGVVPGNAAELPALLAAGALGCKCFLVPSGIDEFPPADVETLRQAMPVLAAHGAVLLVHAELPGPIEAADARLAEEPRSYARYLASRPPAAEAAAIALLVQLVAETGCRVHVVHLADASSLPVLLGARRAGLPISVETCPHYLTFAAEEIEDGATLWKCAPLIRGRVHREGLWKGLRDGTIDLVASDHSPCPPVLKALPYGDFQNAWGGIAGLQLTLPAVWTEASRRGFGLEDLAAWLAERPARLAGLAESKGRLAVGYDADLVIWTPEAPWHVTPEALHDRHRLTPYAGRTLDGVVQQTFLRGRRIYENGRFGDPHGRWLRRAAG